MLIFLYRSNSQEVPLIFSVSLQRQGRASAERSNERAGGLATSHGAPLCNQTGAPIPSGPLGARQQPAPTTACHSTTAGLVFNLYTIYAPSLASRPQVYSPNGYIVRIQDVMAIYGCALKPIVISSEQLLRGSVNTRNWQIVSSVNRLVNWQIFVVFGGQLKRNTGKSSGLSTQKARKL